MSKEPSLQEEQREWHGSIKSYVIGFSVSILLTMVSFGLVVFKILSGNVLLETITVLALMQAIIQLRFFLHLGQEGHPRWETFVFAFMVLVLFIIAAGSLWIMQDLDERMMMGMHM